MYDSSQSQITVQVDVGLLRHFRAGCALRGTSPRREIVRLLAARVEEWEQMPFHETRVPEED